MEFDALSGRTIHADGPLVKVLQARSKKVPHTQFTASNLRDASPHTCLPDSEQYNTPCLHATSADRQLYRSLLPPLTTECLQVVWSRNRSEPCHSQSQANVGILADVTLPVQNQQNIYVPGKPKKDHAITLSRIGTVELGLTQYDLHRHLKPPPDTVRGVIHGLDPNVTNEALPDLLSTYEPTSLHARMLGRATSALLTPTSHCTSKWVAYTQAAGPTDDLCNTANYAENWAADKTSAQPRPDKVLRLRHRRPNIGPFL